MAQPTLQVLDFARMPLSVYQSLGTSWVPGTLYFIEDTPSIYLNGKQYSSVVDISGTLTNIAYNAATRKFTLTYSGGKTSEFELPLASSTADGLLPKDLYTRLKGLSNTLVGVSVTTTLAETATASDKKVVTEKAVRAAIDAVIAGTSGAITTLKVAADEKDPSKILLQGLSGNSVVSSVELDKEKFLSNVNRRDAVKADVTAGDATKVGDPLVEFTLTDGSKFVIDLADLIDTYVGSTGKAIDVVVSGGVITATFKIDAEKNAASAVSLVQGANGVSAQLNWKVYSK